MANFKCVAPGHKPASVLDTTPDWVREWAVHPADSVYQEVHLCRKCASDARELGVRTVELTEARKIIRAYNLEQERKSFFLQFVPGQEEQAMSA